METLESCGLCLQEMMLGLLKLTNEFLAKGEERELIRKLCCDEAKDMFDQKYKIFIKFLIIPSFSSCSFWLLNVEF